ncbi:hypothetical protein [Bradyrhizobium sp. sGM-13]|uniref:hypothetical protein n=1 Tax=Bradyrhizobium sp. sGM-13 TaxID=2831781 RepID=UPI001BCF1F70|nr:hypothetical protein [Bradyrhizobium sp. sGM-13]
MSDYAVLGQVVGTAGVIIAAGGAITLAFKGRERWEPVEEDIPRAPAKVAGLLAAVFIVVIFVLTRGRRDIDWLLSLLIICGVATVIGLFLYVWLIQTQMFTAIIAVDARRTRSTKVIGGLSLTSNARAALAKKQGPKTIQQLFEGAAYDKDLVWTRSSQALAKLLFLAAFLMLQVFGSLSLATAAILLMG